MVNQVILVGRLTRDIEVHTSENGAKVATIAIAVPRSFKNSDGVYDTDFIDCIAFGNVANNTQEYCSRGDTVGIKGRVQSKTIEIEGVKHNKSEIICEKITFLSNRKKEDS